jgi:hypothetical protein
MPGAGKGHNHAPANAHAARTPASDDILCNGSRFIGSWIDICLCSNSIAVYDFLLCIHVTKKSLIHLQTYEGWSTSPPTYENGFFLPPKLSKQDKSLLK